MHLHRFRIEIVGEDPKHVEELERLLSSLHSNVMQDRFGRTPADLIRLGKKAEPNITYSNAAVAYRANQFKVNFQKLREVFSASG